MDKENAIFRSLEIIENRISEKLNVETIASSVYFSKYHYGRLFREIVGSSVMEYVTKRKLTIAGRVLLETNATILDIALRYGFDSHEGFTRSFKAYMGVTPTDYRKYNLITISQKTVKEKCIMSYSKTTDEIIRELNDFIVKAKETAKCARKNEVAEYAQFWKIIADTTDDYANKAKGILDNITAIAEHPDEITSRFAMIKVIEDIAFQSNLLAFNAGLMVSRGQPEHISKQWDLCQKYLELARASSIKVGKIAQFFNELSSLIFEDMREKSIQKIQEIIKKGKIAEESIIGYSYIKDEISIRVNELTSIPYDDISVARLEDCLFKLNIISFAASIEMYRNPSDVAMVHELTAFQESVSNAVDFFQKIIVPESNPILERTAHKRFTDIAIQGNILLFYTRGEVSEEKLGKLLDGEQKISFNAICNKINDFIQVVLNSTEEKMHKEIADRLYEINADMMKEAAKLQERGGAVKFLAGEFKGLADAAKAFSL